MKKGMIFSVAVLLTFVFAMPASAAKIKEFPFGMKLCLKKPFKIVKIRSVEKKGPKNALTQSKEGIGRLFSFGKKSKDEEVNVNDPNMRELRLYSVYAAENFEVEVDELSGLQVGDHVLVDVDGNVTTVSKDEAYQMDHGDSPKTMAKAIEAIHESSRERGVNCCIKGGYDLIFYTGDYETEITIIEKFGVNIAQVNCGEDIETQTRGTKKPRAKRIWYGTAKIYKGVRHKNDPSSFPVCDFKVSHQGPDGKMDITARLTMERETPNKKGGIFGKGTYEKSSADGQNPVTYNIRMVDSEYGMDRLLRVRKEYSGVKINEK